MSDERLRLGQVVERGKERGVVVFAQGRGWDSEGRKRGFGGDYVIRTSWMTSVVGNLDGEWSLVPRCDWTASESARHAMVTHVFPDWWDQADGNPPEYLLIDFRMLVALLPKEDRDEIEEGDIPDICELILAVAAEIDKARGIDPDAAGRPWQLLAEAALRAEYIGSPPTPTPTDQTKERDQ